MKRIVIPRGKLTSRTCRHCEGTERIVCHICEGAGTLHDGSTCTYCKNLRTIVWNGVNGCFKCSQFNKACIP